MFKFKLACPIKVRQLTTVIISATESEKHAKKKRQMEVSYFKLIPL